MINKKHTFASLYKIIKIIVKHEPYYFIFIIPQIICNSILPIINIYFPRYCL